MGRIFLNGFQHFEEFRRRAKQINGMTSRSLENAWKYW
jgi:hypothetical protein